MLRRYLFVLLLCFWTVGEELEDTTVGSTSADSTVENISSEEILNTTVNYSTQVGEDTTVQPLTTPVTVEHDDHPCICDFTMGGCDANCCCDEDCSGGDISAFDSCRSSHHQNDELCFPHYLTPYSNRSGMLYYAKPTSLASLLCITFDNNPRRLLYSTPKAITTKEEFEVFWRRRRGGGWKTKREPSELALFDVDSSYKLGSYVWTFTNTSLPALIDIPVRGVSPWCESVVSVTYKKTITSKCLSRRMSQTECLRANRNPYIVQFEHLYVITSPLLINRTSIENTGDEAFTSVELLNCPYNEHCFVIDGIPKESFNKDDGTCDNVVVSIEVALKTNGSSIEEACVRLRTGSVSIGESVSVLYKVLWEYSNNTRGLLARRVAPGNASPQLVALPKPDSNGYCTISDSILVTYNSNIRIECTINTTLPRDKQSLRWLSTGEWELCWGDEAWVPLLGDPRAGDCLEVRLVSGLTGRASRPLPTLLGAWRSSCNLPRNKASYSVLFVHATKPPLPKFAPSPRLSLTLPKDFFYPFLLSSAPSSPSTIYLYFVSLLLHFIVNC